MRLVRLSYKNSEVWHNVVILIFEINYLFMDTLTIAQTNTIYSLLQNSELDLRDNRGKRHDLCYVFLSLMLALFGNRDGNLSSIHRSMVNKNMELSQSLGLEIMPVISRSHLPVFLQKVDLTLFTKVLFLFLGIKLDKKKSMVCH